MRCSCIPTKFIEEEKEEEEEEEGEEEEEDEGVEVSYTLRERRCANDRTVAATIQGMPRREVIVVTNATASISRCNPLPFLSLFSLDIIKRTVMFWSINKRIVAIRAGNIQRRRSFDPIARMSTNHGRPLVVPSARGTLSMGRDKPYREIAKLAAATPETTPRVGAKSATLSLTVLFDEIWRECDFKYV